MTNMIKLDLVEHLLILMKNSFMSEPSFDINKQLRRYKSIKIVKIM